MSLPDDVRIRHMIEAIEAAMQFTAGRPRADLDADTMLLFALVRAVEVVGEAATRVSDATPARPCPTCPGARLWVCAIESSMPTSMLIVTSCGIPSLSRFQPCFIS